MRQVYPRGAASEPGCDPPEVPSQGLLSRSVRRASVISVSPTLASLRRSIDLVTTPMTILDVGGRIEHINPANERLLGRSADELRGHSIAEILPPDLQARVAPLLATVLRVGRLQGVFQNVRSDGVVVPVEVIADLIRSPAGKPRRIVASIRDIGPLIGQFEQLNASVTGLAAMSGEDFLVTTTRTARALLGARYAALILVDAGRITRVIPDGLTEAEIAAIGHWPDGHGLLGSMIVGRQTLRIADLGADPRFTGFPALHPVMRSFLGTPIKADDEVFGYLYLTDKLETPEFSFLDERLAELFAAHAAVAIRDHRRRAALEAAEMRLARLLDDVSSEIYVFDAAALRFTEANAGALRNIGYALDELRELTPLDLKPELSPASFARLLAPLRTGERDQIAFDTIHRRKDGSTYPVEVRLHLRATEQPPVFVAVIQDITERVAAEEERARLEEVLRARTRNLADAQRIAHIGSWEWDLATDTAQRSDELHRIYGVEPGTLPETTEAFLAFVHPDDRARVQAFERAAVARSGTYSLEYRAVRPDGSIRIIHDEAEAVRDPSGVPVRMFGTAQDITERVAAEAERARLVSAVEQTADSIVLTGLDGTITYANPSFERLYGHAPAEIVGQTMRVLDSGRQEPAFWSELLASVTAGRTWTGAITNRRKDGSLVDVETVISPVHDAAGRLTGFVQADRDVTRERALEGALERDVRERETIEAALERIDAAASPEEIAAAACEEIVRLSGVEAAWVTELAGGHGRLLAADGVTSQAFGPGLEISNARARHLLERASGGPWTEAWQQHREDGRLAEKATALGLQVVAYAPLRVAHGVLGVISIGTRDPAGAERLIERLPALATFGSIVGALVGPGLEARRREDVARASIRAILDTQGFRPFFQPIVELHAGAVVGYEALSRFSDDRRPDVVFALATRAGLGIELEAATLSAAISATAVLPSEAYLSVNVSPAFIGSGELEPLLVGLERPVVLEITEHVVIDDYVALRRHLRVLGRRVRLAVDDAGAGYASLRHILELKPDFVKLDVGLVRRIDADPARQALIAGIGYFAARRKVRIIAEGIETATELETLRGLGISHGQGHLLGHPLDGRGPGPWPTEVALPS